MASARGDRLSAQNSPSPARRRSSSHHASRPTPTAIPITLWTHEPPNFSTSEVVLHPDLPASLGGVGDAELLEVRSLATGDADTSAKGRRFLFRASFAVLDSDAAARSGSQLQLSISRSIATLYGLHNRCDVLLSKVPREPHTISHVELYFRDQYVGRADMWRLAASLEDTCVYVGQRITLAGCVRATIGRIFIREKKVTSGYVASHTRTIFRSESAKYNLLIQLGREMWEFDEDGELYYEKALSGFIPELLRRWRAVPTNHVVSVVLFARVHYDPSELHMLEDAQLPLRKEEGPDGRWYIDYYKVIVDLEGNCDWTAVMTSLKEEFFRFKHDILLLRRPVAGPAGAPDAEETHADLLRRDRALLAGTISASHEGNILEALNLALNPADAHFVDRDLTRTGLDVVVLSAGTGHFRVDKRLLRLTTERMIDGGFGLDLVCLTKMPLHSVPLFHFRSEIPDTQNPAYNGPNIGPSANRSRRPGRRASTTAPSSAPPDPLYFDPAHTGAGSMGGPAAGTTATTGGHFASHGFVDFYSIPHWVDCSFYNLQQDKPFRADRFVPRCKMHEVQMMGIMENEISDISIPSLDLRTAGIPGLVTVPKSLGSSAPMSGADAGHRAHPQNMPPASGSVARQAELDADLAGLEPRDARRIMRERFDRETMRDLETAPAAVRSSMVHAASGRGVPMPSISPSRSLHHSLPSNEQLRSRGNAVGSPVTPGRPGRPGRAGRDSLRTSTLLESHDEHPSPGDSSQLTQQPQRALESPLEISSPVAQHERFSLALSEETMPSAATSRGPSRAPSQSGSIRSLNTLARNNLRPLEPMGKAKAFVAPSDPVFTREYAIEQHSVEPPSPSTQSATSALTNSTSGIRAKSRYRLPTTWLWTSLKGVASSNDGRVQSSSTPASSIAASSSKETLDSSTAASKRIVEILNAQRSAGAPSTAPTSPEKARHDEHAPSPIAIPAGHAPGSTTGSRSADKTGAAAAAADAQIQREQDAYEQALEDDEARARYAQRAQVEKQTLVNPSNPQRSIGAKNAATQLLRWQHLFPRRLNRHSVKWRSMTSPACLPLTTLYLPTEADLASQWLEHPYTMSISSEMTSFLVKRSPSTHPALAVVREMTSQRLAQGFQFIVPAVAELSETSNTAPSATTSRALMSGKPRNFALRQPSELFQPGNLVSGNPIFLSMSNQIHRIAYDRSTGAINVKRYLRRTDHETSPLEYACCVWPRDLPGYQTVRATFHYPDFGAYNWTYLDALIAGHADEDRFIDGLRYWRTRFVVVPSEGGVPSMRAPTGEPYSDEEIRLIGMDRLADLFSRSRLRPRTGNDDRAAPLRFIPTSLDPTASFYDDDFLRQIAATLADDERGEEALRRERSGAASRRRALKDLDLRSIAADMRHETSTLRINDKFWQRVLYEDSFTGADLVTWLCRTYTDVKTREEATEVGARLLREGLFEHVNRAHGFLDGYYFYRLLPEYSTPRSKHWFGTASRGSDETNAGRPATMRHSNGESNGVSMTQSARRGTATAPGANAPLSTASSKPGQATAGRPRRKVAKMSRTHIIDIDPGRKSDRAEVAFLHHDVAHNPANGFNFQIHWLGTTARFIEDTIQVWTRTVERFGLKLIEAPIGQIADVAAHNPFQAPLQIPLALSPPAPSTYASRLPEHTRPEHYFEWALLRHFGFILDQEASNRVPDDVDIVYDSRPKHFEYSQFVHRSGVAFVQVLGGAEGFLWLNNRLFTSHITSAPTRLRDVPMRGGGTQASSSPVGPSGAAAAPPVDADSVRRELTAFCTDPESLEHFYQSVLPM